MKLFIRSLRLPGAKTSVSSRVMRTPMKIRTKKISRFSSPVRNSIAMIHTVNTTVIFSDISTVYSPIFRWNVTFFPLCVVF